MGISAYNTSPSANTAINGINIAEGCPPSGINNAIRQLMADIATDVPNKNAATGYTDSQNWAKSPDLASAATTNIGAAAGNYLHITGTTTISAFDTIQAGTFKVVKFTGILTLTNSGNLILPGGANITTAAGDCAIFVSEGSGAWQCVDYLPAAGTGLVSVGTANQLAYYASNGNIVAGTGAVPTGTTATTPSAGDASTLLATTNFIRNQPQLNQPRLVGVTTNSTPNAGDIGENIAAGRSIGSGLSLTTATAADITSMSLTAGDWDIWANFGVDPGTTATVNAAIAWVSTASATDPGGPNNGAYYQQAGLSITGMGNYLICPLGMTTAALGGTTTIYLSVKASFGAGSGVKGFGFLAARRRR